MLHQLLVEGWIYASCKCACKLDEPSPDILLQGTRLSDRTSHFVFPLQLGLSNVQSSGTSLTLFESCVSLACSALITDMHELTSLIPDGLKAVSYLTRTREPWLLWQARIVRCSSGWGVSEAARKPDERRGGLKSSPTGFLPPQRLLVDLQKQKGAFVNCCALKVPPMVWSAQTVTQAASAEGRSCCYAPLSRSLSLLEASSACHLLSFVLHLCRIEHVIPDEPFGE